MPIINSWTFDLEKAVTPNTGADTTLIIDQTVKTISDFTVAKPVGACGIFGSFTTTPSGLSARINSDEVQDGDLWGVGYFGIQQGFSNEADALNDLLTQLLGSNFSATMTTGTGTLTCQWYVPLSKING